MRAMTTGANVAAPPSTPLSTATWDDVVKDLEEQGGMAVVTLPLFSGDIHAQAFDTARRVLDNPNTVDCPTISPDSDSAHVTGFHSTTGMSRYNAFREGLVFSNGEFMGDENVQLEMENMFDSLHNKIAQHVLQALERRWNLPENWFQTQLGSTECHSQWHVKRYVVPETTNKEMSSDEDNNNRNEASCESTVIWLPVHTDPSLISVVVHDSPGIQKGAMGLQYQTETGKWREIPQSGHCSATIFVGSVLHYMTGGRIRAAKHRVVYTNDIMSERMAATLFVRPRATARLVVPPSPRFQDVSLKKQISFEAWNSRVSRNYMKKKKKT